MNDARHRKLPSSTVTTGVVTAFLVLAALVGCLDETQRLPGATLGTSWRLRGTLIPAAEASPHAAASFARPPLQRPGKPV